MGSRPSVVLEEPDDTDGLVLARFDPGHSLHHRKQ